MAERDEQTRGRSKVSLEEVIDSLVSRGYGSYREIVEYMSDWEILRMYETAIVSKLKDRLDDASASRLAYHADKEGWADYAKKVDAAAHSGTKGKKQATKGTKGDATSFFSQLASIPKPGSRLGSGQKAVKIKAQQPPKP